MLTSKLPVILVCPVRTGAGKSQTTRYLSRVLKQQGRSVAVVRHPMPYGDLAEQRLQRFETLADLDRAQCLKSARNTSRISRLAI
jgi:predicted GTPase